MKTSTAVVLVLLVGALWCQTALSDNLDAHAGISEVSFSLGGDGQVRKALAASEDPTSRSGEDATSRSGEDATSRSGEDAISLSGEHSISRSGEETLTSPPPPGLSLEDVASLTQQLSSSGTTSITEDLQGTVQKPLDTTPSFQALAGDDLSTDDCYNDTFDPLSNFNRALEADYFSETDYYPESDRSVEEGVSPYENEAGERNEFYIPREAVRGKYGGFYRNYHLTENGMLHPFETKIAYLHGKYREPRENYYKHYVHNGTDTSALGYYFGSGLRDLYTRERIKRLYTVNHYHHQEHPNKPQRFATDRPERQTEYVPPEVVIECSFDARALCPENTEAFCYRNGTILCMSRMSALRVCDSYPEMSCVDTVVPCAPASTKLCVGYLETISMPCLTKLVMEVARTGVLLRVAQTFVVAPQPPEQIRSYCAMAIFEPVPPQIE